MADTYEVFYRREPAARCEFVTVLPPWSCTLPAWPDAPETQGRTPRCAFHSESKPSDIKQRLEQAAASRTDIRCAKLHGVDLSGANLSGASLWLATLSAASLWRANLAGATLRLANLSGANLQYANLSRANLLEVNLSGANLQHANLSGAYLHSANLCGANLQYANLSAANLRGANLSRAHLNNADLSGADLSSANLSGVNRSAANLAGANLRRTKLLPGPEGQPPSLARADLRGARLQGLLLGPETIVDGAQFGRSPLGTAEWRVYDELLARTGDRAHQPDIPTYADCADIYRQLKRCFQDSGHYAVAGEFFLHEMQCLRLHMWREGGLRAKAAACVRWLFEKLSGYGERPSWVAAWAATIIVLCAWLQGCFGIREGAQFVVGPGWPESPSLAGLGRFLECLYFSVITFTTTGYGDLKPTPPWGQLMSATEAALGAVLVALFMICMVRKFSR